MLYLIDSGWKRDAQIKSLERKREEREREILINPVHRENGQERREKAKAWLDKAGTQLVNNQSL